VLAAALACLSVAEAQQRTLRWKSMAVEARLEDSGALHVTERHHMVFDGAWNGGERPFRAGAARPELLSLTRVDRRTGAIHPLRPARTPAMAVDEYAWAGSNLRWRNRLATDRPFQHHDAIYVIEYRLRDVVIPEGERYRIAHDFAFTGRPGVIERFTLALDFASSWKAGPGVPLPLERLNLGPEQTVTLRIPLEWTGTGRPQHLGAAVAARPAPALPVAAPPPPPAAAPASPADRLAAFAVFLALAGFATFWFVRGEAASGAYGAAPSITPAWLEENIFRHRPEVIGAAWDGKTGHAEAAALIAVLIAEKKIENLEGRMPRLKLLVPRDTLGEYERAFVDRLFIDGDVIDLDKLKIRYAGSGFNPVDSIRAPIEDEARLIVGGKAASSAGVGCLAGVIIFGLVMPMAGIALFGHGWLLATVAGAILFATTMTLGAVYRTRVKARLLAVAMALPLLVSAAILTATASELTGLAVFLGLTLVLLGAAFKTVRSTRTPREEENLRALRAARRFFKGRLRKGSPPVDEYWIPYLLAFDLGKALDRWSVAATRAEYEADRDRPDRGATSVTSWHDDRRADAGPVYVPGGGAFGGGGASGTWAASIGSFAAAMPAPAAVTDSSGSSYSSDWSSSSSSSDSSGGSDSGGGSGGGW
jgi:uncharacterized membrane protein YgcG